MDFINFISVGIIGFISYRVLNTKSEKNLKAQVKLQGDKIKGTINFEQINSSKVTIQLDLDGFEPNGSHGFHVHLKPIKPSESCDLAGPHFDMSDSPHGGPFDSDKQRHIGDLGNIHADSEGRVRTKFSDYLIKLDGPNSIINRTIVIHEKADDFKTIESSGKRIACGTIYAIKT
jgi:Cu-Zn family superoxide dismutase